MISNEHSIPARKSLSPDYLRALASPLPGIRFCPTGGISALSAREWLALPNVVCVGGSWLSTGALLRSGDWRRIEALAREAAALRAG